jgi:predicted DNA-binding transcriptional regulator AlpA
MTEANQPRIAIGVPALAKRWACAEMTIERRIRNDASFPKLFRLGRVRKFWLDEIEAYERTLFSKRA